MEIWKRYYTQQWLNNKLSPNGEKQAYVEAIRNTLCAFSQPMKPGLCSDLGQEEAGEGH